MTTAERLEQLGIELPSAPEPAGNYEAWVVTGHLIYVSGQLPWKNGQLAFSGRVGDELTVDAGALAARICALNALSQLRLAVRDLDYISRIVRMDGAVHCASGFTDHPRVLDGASDVLLDVLGDRGRHTRTANGVHDMPLGAAVQISLIAEFRDVPPPPRDPGNHVSYWQDLD